MPEIPRCQVVPQPDLQMSFEVNQSERTRWHFDPKYPRPFFFPLYGPSGVSLTRMGHPGAPDHDHHRSVWFAHFKVLGIDFWGDGRGSAHVRQLQWMAMEETDDCCRMAVQMGWFDGHDPEALLHQELIAEVRDDGEGGTLLETQSIFRPVAEQLEFQQTNFGFFAVRVAKSISGHFGGGQITSSDLRSGESEIFGRAAKWMDYSGPIRVGDQTVTEGITYFDHPENPGQPTKWHVREDGWMGASVCRDAPVLTHQDNPVRLRYLLHAHGGALDAPRAAAWHESFSRSLPFQLAESSGHTRYTITRAMG